MESHPCAKGRARMGHPAGFLEKREKGAPPVIRSNVKDKPAFYFPVKVAHPPVTDEF